MNTCEKNYAESDNCGSLTCPRCSKLEAFPFASFAEGYVGIDVQDPNDVMTDAAWEAWDVFVKTLVELGISVTEIADVVRE